MKGRSLSCTTTVIPQLVIKSTCSAQCEVPRDTASHHTALETRSQPTTWGRERRARNYDRLYWGRPKAHQVQNAGHRASHKQINSHILSQRQKSHQPWIKSSLFFEHNSQSLDIFPSLKYFFKKCGDLLLVHILTTSSFSVPPSLWPA